MMLFWLAAALLLGVALALLLAPGWRQRPAVDVDRDQRNVEVVRQRLKELETEGSAGLIAPHELDAARGELEQMLALDLRPDPPARERTVGRGLSTTVLVIAVPIMAGGLYFLVGDPTALRDNPVATVAQQPPAGTAPPPVAELIDKLALRLASNPDDAQGWRMLGRSYMILERFGEAANAFRHLRELVGDEPAVLAQHAGAIAMANGGEITDEAAALLAQALAGDPMDPRGLWLSGIGARQRGDPVQALVYWRALEPLLGDDARASENLQSMIADAESAAASGTPAVVTTPNPTTAAPGASPPELTVQVSVDQRLVDRFSPTDTVFVFARAVTGPPMPLAVARRQAGELPLTVTLNDAMAMAPGMRLSAFDRIRVGARISKSGNALPEPGDLQGESEALATATADKIEIIISDVVP